jgi:hypothetical protein
MGEGHTHFQHGEHWNGLELWWLWPTVPALLLVVLLLWVVVRHIGVADFVDGAHPRLAAGSRVRWRAAVTRHREIAMAFAAYECDPQEVLRRPALADVRQPFTARFVDAFAEACALATDGYPGRAVADAFAVAADRAAHAWTAATEAAERLRAVRFAPGERALLEQVAALLALARQSPHDGERVAAYGRAAERLAELERLCGWVLPQRASAALRKEARAALASSPA